MRTTLLALIALFALSLANPAAAAEPADYAGVFEADPAIDNAGAVEAAIEVIVTEMSPLIRGIARKRLRAAASWSTRYTFEPATDSMNIRSDRRPEGWTTPLDRSEITTTSDKGEDFFLSRWMEGGVLRSNGRSERGSHGNTFELSPDGSRMIVTTTIRNDNLPKPLVYRVQYERTK